MTRTAFAHTAVVSMEGDERGPGAAITLELCGSLDHPPPCPLAAHATSAERHEGQVRLRVLFACEPSDESEVRTRIEHVLRDGQVDTPDGLRVTWTLAESAPDDVQPQERDHAGRLARAVT